MDVNIRETVNELRELEKICLKCRYKTYGKYQCQGCRYAMKKHDYIHRLEEAAKYPQKAALISEEIGIDELVRDMKGLISNNVSRYLERLYSGETSINHSPMFYRSDQDIRLMNEIGEISFNRPMTIQLYQGLREKNLELIRKACEKIEDLNELDSYGKTPLMYACLQGALEIVQELVIRGADVNKRDLLNWTPLFYCKDITIAEYLLTRGADIDAQDYRGYNLLMHHIISKHDFFDFPSSTSIELFKYYISKKIDVNAQDKNGETVLIHLCKSFGNLDLIKFLLYNSNVDVNKIDCKGKDALKYVKENIESIKKSSGVRQGLCIPLNCTEKCVNPLFHKEEFDALCELYNLLIDKLNSSVIHFFDLDGTLLDTNYANFLAYRDAIREYISKEIDYNPLYRFTREKLKQQFTTMSLGEAEKIIAKKEDSFYQYLPKTFLLQPYNFILRNLEKDSCVLLTNASRKRAIELLKYHKLDDSFSHIFCKEDIQKENKFAYAMQKLKIAPNKVIIYENDEKELLKAKNLGLTTPLASEKSPFREFIIKPNTFLSRPVRSFFSLEYIGFNKQGNPSFINTLKNTFDKEDDKHLKDAVQTLSAILLRDLTHIIKILNTKTNLAICVVPRAKAIHCYTDKQLLFQKTISDIACRLQIIDGTNYLIRKQNTKTTHLKNCTQLVNDGDMPFPGITKKTCTISQEIAGKDILLIDDIYTPSVNIDEDALQALFDADAKSVSFYAVGRTTR